MGEPLDYFPIGGINGEDSPLALQANQVAGAENFLFEGGVARSRPGVYRSTSVSSGGRTEDIFYAEFYPRYGSYTGIGVGQTGIYTLWQDGDLAGVYAEIDELQPSFTKLSGAAVSFTAYAASIAAVNGVFMISGNVDLVRYDPNAGTYSLITGQAYRYITSHMTRAVAAYQTSGGTVITNDRKVAWSIAGDETNWTGAGSGSTILSGGCGSITGLETLKHTIVVAREDGFHLGRATGNASPAFDWELHSAEGIGCMEPCSLVAYNGEDPRVFFIGQNDVYAFDLSSVRSIGKAIRKELMAAMKTPLRYCGFISHYSPLDGRRAQYHLVPIDTSGLAAGEPGPHFVYDIEDQVWSKHTYDFATLGGYFHPHSRFGAPVLFEYGIGAAARATQTWSPTTPCEQPQRITGRKMRLGHPSQDKRVNRVLLEYSAREDAIAEMRLDIEQQPLSVTMQAEITGGDYTNRKWFDLQVAANLVQPVLEIPANNHVEVSMLSFDIAEGGAEFR